MKDKAAAFRDVAEAISIIKQMDGSVFFDANQIFRLLSKSAQEFPNLNPTRAATLPVRPAPGYSPT